MFVELLVSVFWKMILILFSFVLDWMVVIWIVVLSWLGVVKLRFVVVGNEEGWEFFLEVIFVELVVGMSFWLLLVGLWFWRSFVWNVFLRFMVCIMVVVVVVVGLILIVKMFLIGLKLISVWLLFVLVEINWMFMLLCLVFGSVVVRWKFVFIEFGGLKWMLSVVEVGGGLFFG